MRRWNRQVVIAVALCMGISSMASAGIGDPSSFSTNYRVVESEIGGNSCANKTVPACGASSNYSLDSNVDDGGASLGESAVGNSSSASYQTNSGFNTTAQPGLTICIGTTGSSCADLTGTGVSLGALTASATNTATAKFSVKDYTSWGYAVTVVGPAPTNNGHALIGMGTQTQNSAGCTPTANRCDSFFGQEQFGINLRANSSPNSAGADPVPIPNSTFSVSDPNVIVTAPYRNINGYRYMNGDTIASAGQSSGETTYTMTFLANMSNTTPGGQYTTNMSIVVTGTY